MDHDRHDEGAPSREETPTAGPGGGTAAGPRSLPDEPRPGATPEHAPVRLGAGVPGDEEPGGPGVAGAVLEFVRVAVTSVGRAGTVSLAAVGDAVEVPGRALVARIVVTAVARPRPVGHHSDLATALERQPHSPLLGGSTAAALAAKVAGRVGPLRFLARRTPMWLVVTAVPAVHASVTRGADELALVASHLVHRARAVDVEPDPERVRRVAVQLVTWAPVDPGEEPRHAPLAVAWLQRALRASLPFSPGVATRDPRGLARAAADVDASTLAAPD